MYTSEPESTEELLVQVCRLHHERARAALHELGLYRGQPPLLSALHRQEGLTQSELAAGLHVTAATMTKMLQRMEKAGWLQRNPDSDDQRVMRVYLTEAGRAIQGEMLAVLQELDSKSLLGFTTEERVLFRCFLLHARDNLLGEDTD